MQYAITDYIFETNSRSNKITKIGISTEKFTANFFSNLTLFVKTLIEVGGWGKSSVIPSILEVFLKLLYFLRSLVVSLLETREATFRFSF